MNLGGTIRTIRKQAGMSQEDLSERTGLSQTSISQIESGIKRPSKRSLQKICSVLDIPEAVLFILALEDKDVPKARRKIFESIYPEIRELTLQLLGDKKKVP